MFIIGQCLLGFWLIQMFLSNFVQIGLTNFQHSFHKPQLIFWLFVCAQVFPLQVKTKVQIKKKKKK